MAPRHALVLPATDEREALADLVARLCFYLSCTDWTVAITTALAGDAAAQALVDPERDFPVPPDLDPRIAQLHRWYAGNLRLIRPGDQAAFEAADVVFVRDATAPTPPRRGRRFYAVDPAGDRMESGNFIQAPFADDQKDPRSTEDSQAKFARFLADVGTAERAYLLGTGPSVNEFSRFSFADGITVACNTAVLDEELWEHTRPRVLAFADPLFHFGCSTYGGAFREAVRAAARRWDFLIAIPLKYYRLFTFLEPGLAARTVGIPYRFGAVNLDLRDEFVVRVIDNVATFLMVPIASTLAERVSVIGFDGRAPDETYFWRHNPRTQLVEHMDAVKRVHPGFFELDYADYYDRHCRNLETYLRAGERLGRRYDSLTPSFIPALRRRSPAQSPARPSVRSDAGFRVVVVDPDREADGGRGKAGDERLVAAVREAGGDAVVLGTRAPVATELPDWYVPTFTHDTVTALGPEGARHRRRFEEELAAALDDLAAPAPTSVVMGPVSTWHLPASLRVAAAHPELTCALVLDHDAAALLEAWDRAEANGPAVPAVRALAVSGAARALLGVHVLAPSTEFAAVAASLTGEQLPVWPLVGSLAVGTGATMSRREPDRAVVYAPVPADDPGWRVLGALAADIDAARVEVVVPPLPGLGVSKAAQDAVKVLTERARVLDGPPTGGGYRAVLEEADVVFLAAGRAPSLVVPPEAAVDALLLGRPVVAVRQSWAGRIIEQYGVGATYLQGDFRQARGAVHEALARAGEPGFGERVAAALEAVGVASAPADAVRLLRELPARPASASPADGLADLVETAMTALSEWRSAAAALAALELEAAAAPSG